MKIFILSLFIFIAAAANAQSVTPSVLNAAGGTYRSPTRNFLLEWNFGEGISIDVFSNTHNMLTSGVLQPCTDKMYTNQSNIFANTDYILYPNNTSGPFEISFFMKEGGKMTIQLLDASGRLLQKREHDYTCCNRIERFDLGRYVNGVYLVHVLFDADTGLSKEGTFRVVKF